MATELKPIRSEADYDKALREVERLWGAKNGTPKGDRLDVLITLIEAYEDEHYPMGEADPIDFIEFRMDHQGLTRKDLEPLIGGRARVAEVLSRKRDLTLPMIRRLHTQLGIPADVLVRPTRPRAAALAQGASPRKRAPAPASRRQGRPQARG
jgi:HTH-type transcriptional regulator/antitoxin HigA